MTEGVWVGGWSGLRAVGGLFFPSGPAAVAGFVAFGVVIAFEGHAWRGFAHVGAEVLEALVTVPERGDLDAFAVVVIVSWVGWRIATGVH